MFGYEYIIIVLKISDIWYFWKFLGKIIIEIKIFFIFFRL